MPIEIKIKGNSSKPEYKDAEELRDIFKSELPQELNGKILIVSNVTLFGQETKDLDLVVLGNFEKYSLDLKTKSHLTDSKFELRKVFINNFCFCIETKRHTQQDIYLDGVTLAVKYNGKLHDVTTQSENQKYALRNFFIDRLDTSLFICNFIWLKNLNKDGLFALIGNNSQARLKHNYLPSSFNIKWLFQLACIQHSPFAVPEKNYCIFQSQKRNQAQNPEELSKAFDIFESIRNTIGNLTRKKIEHITNQLLGDQQYAQAIGNQLVVISGKAGTGKTIKLLRIARDLATNKGKRCLILTYNHALVSDIKRTLALIEIPDGIENETVNIITLHKFFYELMLGFGITNENNYKDDVLKSRKFIADFVEKYETYLENLYSYLEAELIQETDIQAIMKSRFSAVAWDYLLIDEAQDWDEREKRLLYKIFGSNKIIIADGIDQLVRSQQKCNWISGIQFKKTNEKRGLRQKVNLISFVNSFAEKFDLNWSLEPLKVLEGGKVIISNSNIDYKLFRDEFENSKNNGNNAYEMLYLVPPNLVLRKKEKENEIREFSLKTEFESNGINIWDGTNNDLRTSYPVDLSQHRLLQYESCRGLEGWTVVCLELDEFVNYKQRTYSDINNNNELLLDTLETRKNKFVSLWSLIPLTRAIDTLIITLKNPSSEFSKILKEIYLENQDFVEWRF